MIEVRRG